MRQATPQFPIGVIRQSHRALSFLARSNLSGSAAQRASRCLNRPADGRILQLPISNKCFNFSSCKYLAPLDATLSTQSRVAGKSDLETSVLQFNDQDLMRDVLEILDLVLRSVFPNHLTCPPSKLLLLTALSSSDVSVSKINDQTVMPGCMRLALTAGVLDPQNSNALVLKLNARAHSRTL